MYDLEYHNEFKTDNLILYGYSKWAEIQKEDAIKILKLRDDSTRITKLFGRELKGE